MRIIVTNWNIDGWHTIPKEQLALLDATGAELLLRAGSDHGLVTAELTLTGDR